MADKGKKKSPQEAAGAPPSAEIHNEDFQFVLKALLAAYEPVLEHQLNLAKNPSELEKEAELGPPDSKEELARANQIFEKFLTDEVAFRMLPSEARGPAGSIDNWRWCVRHLRCCFVFGWLVCRGPRTFRAWTYYLYEYWRCVRETLGRPVAANPTEEDRKDFQTLVDALAAAFKPYLTDQLASVEYPAGIPNEVLSGKISATEGQGDVCAIFERFLTGDAAQALLGKEAFVELRKEPNSWFCRCWCLCAMCFGCCVARARSLDGLVWCLVYFFRCLRACAQPLACSLTGPTGCITGETDILPGRILQPVVGSAYGFDFGHYIIEVRDGASVLLSGVVIYPDGLGNPDTTLTQGNFAVGSGNLGWIDLQQCVIAAGIDIFTSTTFTVTLRVFSAGGTELLPDCVTTFELSLDEVDIKQISLNWSVNFTDPNEPLRVADSAAATLATQGGEVNVRGNAYITGCAGQAISEYTIWAIPDPTFSFPQPPALSSITPGGTWVLVTHIAYTAQTIAQPVGPAITYTADQVRADNELNGSPDSILTNVWGTKLECPSIMIDAIDFAPSCWNLPSLYPSAFDSNVLPKLAPILEGGTGKFTFLLQVIDTLGNQLYDVQRAWIDNEPIHTTITGIGCLPACSDLYTQTSAGVFKTVNIRGTAWDQLIDPATPDLTRPTSDNFDEYTIEFQKQGAAGWASLVSSTSPVPPRPLPLGVGTLGLWDLQSVDAASNPMGLPPDQLLALGQACEYNIFLQAWDLTLVDEGTVHYNWYMFPVKIINGPEPATAASPCLDSLATVSSSPNPSVLTQPVTFSVNVTAVPPATGTPTGTVQFIVDGTNYGPPVSLSGGSASVTDLGLGAGTHTITAVYLGDGTFNNTGADAGSTATTVIQTVT